MARKAVSAGTTTKRPKPAAPAAVRRSAARRKPRSTAATASADNATSSATAKALQQYAAKRTFSGTPEPVPQVVGARSGPLLFVVQQHSARALHFDLRLELDGVLKSWAVPKGPSLDPTDKRLAVPTEDHPLDYGTFEGVIPPKQYGAGEVIVWDCGIYSPDENAHYSFADRETAQARVRAELAAGKLSVFLLGEKLKGSFALVRTTKNNTWLLIKHKDRAWRERLPAPHERSVLSNIAVHALKTQPAPSRLPLSRLTVHGIAEALPQKLKPMLAETAPRPFDDPAWSFEPKLDGYRIVASVDHGIVKLSSRTGQDYTAAFPEIVRALQQQVLPTMLLDGEIVAFDQGAPSFNALQNRAQLKFQADIDSATRTTPCVMYCFDLLHVAGINLRSASYADRRRYLLQCVLPSPALQCIHTDTHGRTMYDAALQTGLEGIVAKKLDSPYEAGRRSANWLKVKSLQSAEFIVGGYTQGNGHRKDTLGALLLGYWNDAGKLTYVGNVGTGFDDSALRALRARLAPLRRPDSPFTAVAPQETPVNWVEPTLVAEVSFTDITPTQQLRTPVFMRLREDIAAGSIRKIAARAQGQHNEQAQLKAQIDAVLAQLEADSEQMVLRVGSEQIRLTNLSKVLWPSKRKSDALTKRDYLRYLARIACYILPHLTDRPLTVIRMPDGISGERFFQKHWDSVTLPPFVQTVEVFSETKDVNHRYPLCNNLAALLWFGQTGALEFHVWHSRTNPAPERGGASTQFTGSIENLDRSILNFPDYLVFDLDPYIYSGKEAKGAEPEFNRIAFDRGREVAFRLNEILLAMNLRSVVKTSGKTGLHVFVPIVRSLDFDAARKVCEMVCKHLVQRYPNDVTIEWATQKRTGKIFLDYNMNGRSRTLNSAYSPRGVAGAPISMPLTWAELARAYPDEFTMRSAFDRLNERTDVWANVLNEKQNLESILGDN